MEDLTIVDQLLICLVEHPRNVPMTMRAAGHTQEQISEAWREARRAGYTELLWSGGRALGEPGERLGR